MNPSNQGWKKYSLISRESFESEDSIRYKSSSSHISELKTKYGLSKNNPLCRFLSRRTPLSQSNSVRRYIPKVLSAISSSDTDQTNVEAEQPVAMANSLEIECNRINCLVWVLHESARSFSVAIQKLKLTRRDPELAMAWVGIDVHSWHKKIAYQLHHLAREAGFEEDFLLHFGSKILPSKNTENMEFWIGLVRAKLSEAFHRESVISGKQAFCDKDQENNLSILGLFAYLGRETRLFISRMKIKDLDEQVVDFLSYLECGTLFIYPKFSSLREYQLFMEVVTDEIGWLDFYAEYYCKFYQGRRRSKQHKIQAEKEIILHTVFTVCYDVFSGFAHYSNSTQQPLDSNLLAFLLRSQSLLSICLEDYWAAYDRSGTSEHMKNLEGAQWKPIDFRKRGSEQHGSEVTKTAQIRQGLIPESKSLYGSLLSKSSSKLISASTAIWMGTQLLCVDVLVSLKLFMKQLLGKKVTEREKKKIDKTLADIATLIPVTILMLIPVSAVGHAAMLTAIKRYIPALIPSPYCSERLNMVKQLKRTKKMEIQAWSNIEDNAMFGEGSREVKEGSCLSGSKMHEEDNGSRKTEVQS
uniref:Uncharacterized protein n=1 Tax=Daucus carota subsp. sativus TaxID=79200 RepID=A0A166ELT7_DAUCS